MNVILTLSIKIAEVGGGKVLALDEVLLPPLVLETDGLDNFLGVLTNSWVVGIWGFNHVDPLFEERKRKRAAVAATTKWAFRGTARLDRASIVTVL
jgi:hypothetical protein